MSLPASLPDWAIEAEGLYKTYAATKTTPAKTALNGIDLKIPRGSIFGLLGPNGAGKSTYINTLSGLVRKSAGTVKIWGMDIDSHPRDARAAIGVVAQEIVADVFFTPRESLETQAGLFGVPPHERRTAELLAAVGLTEQAEAYVRQLSGGMKRRLMVAKAMTHNPPVLILDEPTAGVDVASPSSSPPTIWRRRRSSATPSPSSTAARWWPASRRRNCCAGWTPAPW